MAIATSQLIIAMVLALVLLAIIIFCANLIQGNGRPAGKSKAPQHKKPGPETLSSRRISSSSSAVLLDENGHAKSS